MDTKTPDDTRTVLRGGALDGEAIAEFQVAIANGPAAGTAWIVSGADPQRVYLGSSDACEMKVSDEHVSRRHLALAATPEGLKVEDVGSKNGTWLGSVRVGQVHLSGGEVLTVGTTQLRIEAIREPKPSRAPPTVRFGRILGASLAMRKRYAVYQRIAQSDVPVLIEGETGTGKELLAESMHEASPRASAPFVIFDCTTVAPNLLESALFGHEKGAFTGANAAKPGVFELADGGTLFIDEIGDLDIALQAKLLRAIQSQQVQRIGGTKWIRTNVRIISATRRDLEREIQAGRFRDDLFFRLVIARVELPPLRERRDDVPLLARAFWKALGGREADFPPDLLAGLDDYAWPGNVRELHNKVAHRLALGDLVDLAPSPARSSVLPPPPGSSPSVLPSSASVLPAPHARPAASWAGHGDIVDRVIAERAPFARARERVLFDFERRYTDWVLAEHHGNVTRAAEACGVGRRHFYVIRSRSGGG